MIPAAGSGSRMQADRPKQYLPLAGRTVLEHTLRCFHGHPHITGIVLVLSAEDPHWDASGLQQSYPVHRVEGGTERCHSVLNALEYLSGYASDQDWVLVHDAARPCLRRNDLDQLLDRLSSDPVGGLLATPVRDTMKRSDASDRVQQTVDRNHLWHALTPQMFRIGRLRAAMHSAMQHGLLVTDEASAIEADGHAPLLVHGGVDNIKITRPEDLVLAEFYLSQQGRDTI